MIVYHFLRGFDLMYIGIDLGGTNIAVGLVDEKGKIQGLDMVEMKKSEPYLFNEVSVQFEGTGKPAKGNGEKFEKASIFTQSARKAAGI